MKATQIVSAISLVLAVGAWTTANATESSDSSGGLQIVTTPSNSFDFDQYVEPHDSASTQITTPQTLRTDSTVFPNVIARQVRAALGFALSGALMSDSGGSFRESGRSAGDLSGKLGIWGNYSRTNSDNDLSSTKFDSDLDTFIAGVDYRLTDKAVLGVTLGYENNDIDTDFNGGGQSIDGYTVAPYLGFVVTPSISVDLSAGYSNLDIDQDRLSAGTRVSSSVDADRPFISGNVNFYRSIENWRLGGRVGYLYTRENQESFTESDGTLNPALNTALGQVRVGGDVGYSISTAHGYLEPYATALFEHDALRDTVTVAPGLAQPSDDRDDFQLGLGLRFYGNKGLSSNFEWTTVEGRDNYDNDIYSLTVRMDM